MRALAIALLLIGSVHAAPEPEGLKAFTTDGCSRFPDRSRITGKDWCDCCLHHDLAYWRGGTEAERLKADQELRRCVLKHTDEPGLAEGMYLGVRAGGGPQHRTNYRWGYGWPHGRGYKALTAIETAEADKLQADYTATNPGLVCHAHKP